MDCTFSDLTYGDTGYFSNIVTSYVNSDERLRPFIQYPVSFDSIADAIEKRKQLPADRKVLVSELRKQYTELDVIGKVADNIDLLLKENTFTVCTAHQPAIFTGNLFFIYKILHAIRLAEKLQYQFPENNFVPVFYMGSEDADLDELGNISMNGEKILWDTRQQGAIGRMQPKGLEKIIERIEGQLVIYSHGKELIHLLKECYLGSSDIQTATLKLIHLLFAEFGLLVLIPDNANLKKQVVDVFEDELLNQTSAGIVSRTVEKIAKEFKVQAHPRDINLFYLKDDTRERIERVGEEWKVVNTNITFNKENVLRELHEHPERFSPNVILRGILQETILPNIAFIGGGGELAYWMELKELFEHYKVSYPMLVVRNSFIVIEQKWKDKLDKLHLTIIDIFKNDQSLLNELVKRDTFKQLSLEKEIKQISEYYSHLKSVAENADHTLGAHVSALRARTIKPLEALAKKMLRAEKRKFKDHASQITSMRKALFPNNGLQERVDNFMPFYAKWGKDFIKMIHDHSYSLEQKFGVLIVKD
jgi:bacillithiol biosynthesis cysteine-adding enzyme BshC